MTTKHFEDNHWITPAPKPKKAHPIRNGLIASGAIVAVSVGGGAAKHAHDADAKAQSYPACEIGFSPDANNVSAVEHKLGADGHAAEVLNPDGTVYRGSDRLEPADGTVKVEHVNPNVCLQAGGIVLRANGMIEK